MVYYLILCQSLTHSIRAERVLQRAGIPAGMMRLPNNISTAGCAYGVRLPQHTRSRALAVLHSAGIDYQKLYMLSPGGVIEEVAL